MNHWPQLTLTRRGGVLQDQHEEWQYGERRYISDISLRRLADMLSTDTPETASRTVVLG